MDKKDLKNLNGEALRQEIMSLRKELFNLRLNRTSGQIKDLSQFSKLRKQIAVAQTFLRQQEIAAGK